MLNGMPMHRLKFESQPILLPSIILVLLDTYQSPAYTLKVFSSRLEKIFNPLTRSTHGFYD